MERLREWRRNERLRLELEAEQARTRAEERAKEPVCLRRNVIFNREHAFRPSHFKDFPDLRAEDIESRIEDQLNRFSPFNKPGLGNHWGWVDVNGTWVEYRFFVTEDGQEHVNTYFPVRGPLQNKRPL